MNTTSTGEETGKKQRFLLFIPNRRSLTTINQKSILFCVSTSLLLIIPILHSKCHTNMYSFAVKPNFVGTVSFDDLMYEVAGIDLATWKREDMFKETQSRAASAMEWQPEVQVKVVEKEVVKEVIIEKEPEIPEVIQPEPEPEPVKEKTPEPKEVGSICYNWGVIFLSQPSRKQGTLKLIHPSVPLSVCHKNFNLAHIFCSINDRALIIGMHDPFDKPSQLAPCCDLDL